MNSSKSSDDRTQIQLPDEAHNDLSPDALATIQRTIQATYSQLESCIENAKLITPVQTAQQLLQLLPGGSIESRRFLLCELIKLDMQAALKHSISRTIDFYLSVSPDCLESCDVPIDLILSEIQLLTELGQLPSLPVYQQRFPRWADALAEIHGAPKPLHPSGASAGLPELEIGQAIDDFHIISSLGRGAFAQVYLARQESMQRLVALKVSTQSSEEPITLSQLDHPNIVRVFDQRRLPQGSVHLLYMQAILGGTLSNVIKSTAELKLDQLNGGRLLEVVDSSLLEAGQQPPERASDPLSNMNWAAVIAWLGVQMAEGLQSAHDQGVLHCDVKPANILLAPSGQPKLVDFNVSDRGWNQMRERRIGGTLSYMAPEHLATASNPDDENRIDHRSDLYSLAMVLWELWQGIRPWQFSGTADTWRSAVAAQIELRTQPLAYTRHDSTPQGAWLEKVLRQCLEHDPQRRPQSCREMATRLRMALHPDLLSLLTPARSSLAGKLLRLPVLLVMALIVFSSNGPAAIVNFVYNLEVIVKRYDQIVPHFHHISLVMNLIAFPVGSAVLIYFCWRVSRSMRRAQQGMVATESDIDWIWRFGNRAAVISAALWLVFGVIFPVVLQRFEPSLSTADFVHFFLSLAVCGGIALVYPFFGISLLAIHVYYPQLMLPSMRDDRYAIRSAWLRGWADFYLAMAAIVPLLAILLLMITRSEAPLSLQILLVAITLVSLIVSFKFHRQLNRILEQLRSIFV